MNKFYVLRDGVVQATTTTRDLAIDIIRQHQEFDSIDGGLPWLLPNYSILTVTNEEFVEFELPSKKRNSKRRTASK